MKDIWRAHVCVRDKHSFQQYQVSTVMLWLVVTEIDAYIYSAVSLKNIAPIIRRDISLVVRNPVFGVSDLVRHKPGCAVTEDG